MKRIYRQISFNEETITPKLAREWLARNEHNRKLSQPLVEQYAQEIRDGHWHLTHQSVAFDWFDNLFDGQHRLAAIVLANKSVKVWIARGFDPAHRHVVDTGKKRTAGDMLSAEGFKSHTALAATARYIAAFRAITAGALQPKGLGRNKVSRDDVKTFCEENTEAMYEAVRTVKRKNAHLVFRSQTMYAALFFLFSEVNKTQATEFFTQLVTPDGLTQASPIMKLRNELQTDKQASGRNRKPLYISAAMTIKAWNAFLHDQRVSKLRFNDNEVWPTMNRRRVRRAAAAKSRPGKRATKK